MTLWDDSPARNPALYSVFRGGSWKTFVGDVWALSNLQACSLAAERLGMPADNMVAVRHGAALTLAEQQAVARGAS